MRLPYHRLADHRLGLREMNTPDPGATTVLAFPYAGGQSLAYRALGQNLPSDYRLLAVDLPGHGWAKGPPLEAIEEMADLCEEELEPFITEPCVVVGMSFGGLLAYEFVRRRSAAGQPPKALVMIATRPPHRRGDQGRFSELDEASLLQLLIRIGSIPVEWLGHPEMLRMVMPPLRADLIAFDTFKVRTFPPEIPSLVIVGTEDTLCLPEFGPEWADYVHEPSIVELKGGHFMMQTDPASVADSLTNFLLPLVR